MQLLIELSRLVHAHIAYVIAIVKITVEICRISHCCAWFDTVEFIRLPCPNDKMYDNEVCIHRFRYPLAVFKIRVLIGLSWLLPAHIAYVIDISKIIAAFCWISYCLHNFIRMFSFNRLPCPNDKMYNYGVFTDRFRYQLTMFEVCILIWLSRLDHAHIAYEIVLYKITTGNWHDVGNEFPCRNVVDVDNRYMDERRVSKANKDSHYIYIYIYIYI